MSFFVLAESLEEGGAMGVEGQGHSCYYQFSEVVLVVLECLLTVCVSIVSGFADSL